MTRELALQITRKGSSLFDLLGKEPVLRVSSGRIHRCWRYKIFSNIVIRFQETRVAQANSYVDVGEVEAMIRKVIDDTNKNIVQVKQQIENISSTESSLDAKISKKESDLERVRKRLETLKGVRYRQHAEIKRYRIT